MEISRTGPAGAGVPAAGAGSTSGSGLSSDFETFLRMLTVQLQNQDPLNPMESNDFSVQLATFSGVEQQVKTNELLSGLAERMGGTAFSQYAGWVGKEVRGAGAASFDGDPVTVTAPAVPLADRADLVVRDESGRIVERRPVDPAGGEVVWTGVSETGDPFLAGLYTFSVEAGSGDRTLGETPAEIRGSVREVRVAPEGRLELVLDGGAVMSPGSVTALRLSGP
jgi:flagellar basal-body rod modification protein FlgD